MESHNDAKEQMSKISRRSFIWAGLAVLGSVSAITWLGAQAPVRGVQGPLRKTQDLNDSIMLALFREHRLEPELATAAITPPEKVHTNGVYGEITEIPADFSLTVMTPDGELHEFTMEQIRAMPSKEMVTEFRCVEGWDQVLGWKGVPFRDLFKEVMKGVSQVPKYVKMETADSEYYVGLDLDSAIHPQTILAYELNGQPIPVEHGAPLRLVIPVKYGVKNIKWVAQITISEDQPKDYWAERGYTWFAGL